MVLLDKMVASKDRTLHSDLGLFLLQSQDTFKKADSATAEMVMEMMHKSICSHYGLSNEDFNLVLSSYVCGLYKNSSYGAVQSIRY